MTARALIFIYSLASMAYVAAAFFANSALFLVYGAVFFTLAVLFAATVHNRRERTTHVDPLAALDSMPLSWEDPESAAYEPNPDVRDLIAQGWPVAQARDMVRVEGGDPERGPTPEEFQGVTVREVVGGSKPWEWRASANGAHNVGWADTRERAEERGAAALESILNEEPQTLPPPAPGTTRTVRFDFRDETLTNSGKRLDGNWLADTKLFHLDRRRAARGRGTYRIEVTDRHGKSHWGPPYVTREDALAAMPQAVASVNAGRAATATNAAYVKIVRLDADGKWTAT